MIKRKILLVAVAAALAAAIGIGTVAYFTATNSVTNKFMVADYDPENPYDDPDDIFDITVDEADVTDPDFDPDDPEHSPRTNEGNNYDKMLPGDVYCKDPTIQNAGKYPMYARVKVTVSNAQNWIDTCKKWEIDELSEIFGDYNEHFKRMQIFADNQTVCLEPKDIASLTDTSNLTYVYYLDHILMPGERETLFKSVTLPYYFDNDDMLALQAFDIKIAAEAIQSGHTAVDENGMEREDGAYDAFATHWTVNNPDASY